MGTAKRTPSEYKNVSNVDKELYDSDTSRIKRILYKMIFAHTDPFFSKEYDTESKIYIDSLVYSPDKSKMIALLITRNNSKKLLSKEDYGEYFYNANYLYITKSKKGDTIKVYSNSSYNLVDGHSYEQISNDLRNMCFVRLYHKDSTDVHYNIDDVRFWNSKDFNLSLQYSKPTTL